MFLAAMFMISMRPESLGMKETSNLMIPSWVKDIINFIKISKKFSATKNLKSMAKILR